jgi:transcription-repair coupling factor (superfamily II helicase)
VRLANVNLSGVIQLLKESSPYRAILEALDGAPGGTQRSGLAMGVLTAARPALVATLQTDWPAPILWIAGSPDTARQNADQARIWSLTPGKVSHFPAPDAIFYDPNPWDSSTVHSRSSLLAEMAALQQDRSAGAGQGLLISTSMWALMPRSVSPLAFRRAMDRLSAGRIISPYQLLERCVLLGYEPAVVVEGPGTFSHRGSIVDFWPPHADQPTRVDFFGDEIDSMRTFDPADQRSRDEVSEALLAPASEALPEWGKAASAALGELDLSACEAACRQRIAEQVGHLARGEAFTGMEYYLPYLYPRPGNLLSFLPRGTLVLLDDVVDVRSAALGLAEQAQGLRAEMAAAGKLPPNFATPYFLWEELEERLTALSAVSLGLGYGEEEHPEGAEGFIAAPRYGGQLAHVLSNVAELRDDERRVVLITRQAQRLADLLREERINTYASDGLPEPPERGSVSLIDGIVGEGWALPQAGLLVLSDTEIFGWARARRRAQPSKARLAPESFFADLRPNDYIVHLDHGIGRFLGMVRKAIGGIEREYLEIEYASADRLYVPVQQANRVSRYLGADDRTPYMHRLGGNEWQTVRARAEKAVRDLAVDLLELYATREVTPGHGFAPDTTWQRELEDSFPYEETDDQVRALEEIKEDMEQPRPMDRLLCGDVGYGKTEVALRAAFKAVMDGKQVAVLVPTTVLAQQHYYTFRRRLRAFPVNVEMLSRFRSPADQNAVIEDLLRGSVDIIIGTHRLLSADVTFKDLGLLIIDEEQRFGVAHKERLKQLRREVDVLTLTATPIPRTLSLALSGARDMSIIDTPPEERLPVRTYVSEHDEALIRRAILREIDRGGQVFFVHNRVQDIHDVADRLARVVPEASVVVGHGQMDEGELAQVMLGFAQGEYDVLLSTTIIESGLDIPNVNTIIIDRGDAMGLAQLYQLRGRVGRGANRAYAYLFYKEPLSDIARQRLQTIQEATELGAGFRVAMRDLEIRGAGEILGAEQHGHIAAIGFDLYTRLLQKAVAELRAQSGDTVAAMRRAQHAVATSGALETGVSIDLPVSAYLPEGFMPDGQLRLRFYRRMARVESEEEVDSLAQEMRDRFGQIDEPVEGLLYILRVRTLAEASGVRSLSRDEARITLVLPMPLTPEAARSLGSQFSDATARGNRVWLDLTPTWREQLLGLLRRLLDLRPLAQVSA